jgi:hypothetical protein
MTVWSALNGMVRRSASGHVNARRKPVRHRRMRPLAVELLEGRSLLSRAGLLYISSFGTNTVERYENIRFAPEPAPGQTGATFVAPDSGGVNHPLAVLLRPLDDNLYVTSLETNEVLRYNGRTGVFLDSPIYGDPQLVNPAGMIFGPDGYTLYVVSTFNATVLRYNLQRPGSPGQLVADLGTMGATGIVFGPDGMLYVNTRFSNGVMRCDVSVPGGDCQDFVTPGSGGLERSGGSVFGRDGNLYVTSEVTNNVLRFNGATGEFMGEFVASGSGGLTRPAGLLFGPFGDLYVASVGTNSILHYNGRTGAYINTVISRHDDQVLSGPRGLFFTRTNPTTLQYDGGRSAGDASEDAAASSPGLGKEVAGLPVDRILTTDLGGIVLRPNPHMSRASLPLMPVHSTVSIADVASQSRTLSEGPNRILPNAFAGRYTRDIFFGMDQSPGVFAADLFV